MRWNDTHRFKVYIKRYNVWNGDTTIEIVKDGIDIYEARQILGNVKSRLSNDMEMKSGSSSKGHRKAIFIDRLNDDAVFVSYALSKEILTNYMPNRDGYAKFLTSV